MGIARRSERDWAAEAPRSGAGRYLALAAGYLGTAARELRYQFDESSRPHQVRHYLTWKDGRRYRATAAGRRRGTAGTTTLYSLRPGALVAFLVIPLLAVASFLGTSALLLRFSSDLPDARSIGGLTLPQDSLVYDSGGKVLLADLHQKGYRHYEQSLKDMGPLVPAATISIEDANFYHEPGVDVQAMVRAAWIDYHSHGSVQGASTITQQLVKMRLLGSQKNFDRKIREAALAVQVEQAYSKDQILEMYLNTAFYGNNAYGIKAAALNYFHKDTNQLTLGQAAMLAGIVQNPSYNNPLVNWEGSRVRQHQVLAAMVRNHRITQAQADQAFAEDISPQSGHMFYDSNVVQAPGFVDYVTKELQARYGADAPYRDGYVVRTTLNWDIQQKAQAVVNANIDKFQSWGANVHQGAMVAVDPQSGGVMAMIGSDPGQPDGQRNYATWPPRNPGSSMKIFNYTAAIASKLYTMVSPIPDSPITFPPPPGSTDKPWTPQNYDGRTHGTCQMQACFLNSFNIPAVRVELGLPNGPADVAATARTLGAPPWQCGDPPACQHFVNDLPLNSYGPSLTLGGYGETPLQMAQGAQVLAAQGVMRPVHGLAEVSSPDGTLLFKRDPNQDAKQVLDPMVAYIMEQIMSDDDNRAMVFGRGSNLTLPNRKVASKTGTTDDYRDGWTVGYTPAVASAFWFGNPDFSQMPKGAEASEVAAPVWHEFMRWTLDDYLKRPSGEWFNEPPGLQHYNVNGKLQWFLPGTSPSQPVPQPKGILTYVIPNQPSPNPSPKP